MFIFDTAGWWTAVTLDLVSRVAQGSHATHYWRSEENLICITSAGDHFYRWYGGLLDGGHFGPGGPCNLGRSCDFLIGVLGKAGFFFLNQYQTAEWNGSRTGLAVISETGIKFGKNSYWLSDSGSGSRCPSEWAWMNMSDCECEWIAMTESRQRVTVSGCTFGLQFI